MVSHLLETQAAKCNGKPQAATVAAFHVFNVFELCLGKSHKFGLCGSSTQRDKQVPGADSRIILFFCNALGRINNVLELLESHVFIEQQGR